MCAKAYDMYFLRTAYAPMEAADKLVLTRETIVAVARKNGMRASFLPKIFAMQAGTESYRLGLI